MNNEVMLRDQLAMAALTGFLANPDNNYTQAECAIYAYSMADVMMKARECSISSSSSGQ